MTTPVLHTERLLLRGWREDDLAPFADLNRDPEVVEFLNGPLTRGESDAFVRRIRESWTKNGYGLWAVEAQGEFVGYVGLWDALFEAPFTPTVEIGWRLARRAWGHGYATEAARAALEYGYHARGLDEVLSFTAVLNRRSRAVMERLGMERVPGGDFEHPRVPVGSPLQHHVLYRLPPGAAGRIQAGVRGSAVGVASDHPTDRRV